MSISYGLSGHRAADEKYLTASDKIAHKRNSRCDEFGYYVMEPKMPYDYAYDTGIDRQSQGSDRDETQEFVAPVAQPMLLERKFQR
jgi:hypothetical protein